MLLHASHSTRLGTHVVISKFLICELEGLCEIHAIPEIPKLLHGGDVVQVNHAHQPTNSR